MTEDDAITAAIIGELIPELAYAAPVLLERFDRGDRLVTTASPTDVGFETGAVDSVLLEFFKALVPSVRTVLGYGVLGLVQARLLAGRQWRHHAELIAAVSALLDENAKLRRAVERIADLLARREGAPVPVESVVEALAEATCRVVEQDSVPTHG